MHFNPVKITLNGFEILFFSSHYVDFDVLQVVYDNEICKSHDRYFAGSTSHYQTSFMICKTNIRAFISDVKHLLQTTICDM